MVLSNAGQENRRTERSIRFKAIESYITLEKQILPCCKEADNFKLALLVVVDVDAVEDYESTLSELGGEHTPIKTTNNNEISNISDSLKSYSLKKDKHEPNGYYYYDTIRVMSVEEFEKYFVSILNKVINPTINEHQPA